MYMYCSQTQEESGEHTDQEVGMAEYVGGVVTQKEEPCKLFLSFSSEKTTWYMS